MARRLQSRSLWVVKKVKGNVFLFEVLEVRAKEDLEKKGTDLNGTYLTFFGCPFSRTSALASLRACISMG